MPRRTVHRIPVYPFSQRVEVLRALKGCCDRVDLQVVDIKQPRLQTQLRKFGGPTPLQVFETADGCCQR